MRRLILGLMGDDPSGTIEQARHGDRAIETERVGTFDGKDLIDGTAMGFVEYEREVPEIAVPADPDKRDEGEFSIFRERVERSKQVATDFLADLDAGYVTIDSSDGTFFWEMLEPMLDTRIGRAELDLDAIAQTVADNDDLHVWQSGWDDPDEDTDDVGVAYHDAAELPERGCTQLGFSGEWADYGYLRGTLAASGYVALFKDLPGEVVAEWLRSEILPHATMPETDQQFLADVRDAERSDSTDGETSSGSLDDLETVNVSGGEE